MDSSISFHEAIDNYLTEYGGVVQVIDNKTKRDIFYVKDNGVVFVFEDELKTPEEKEFVSKHMNKFFSKIYHNDIHFFNKKMSVKN